MTEEEKLEYLQKKKDAQRQKTSEKKRLAFLESRKVETITKFCMLSFEFL